MAESRVTQRVAAILAADAVGYTRLMADDEPATMDALDAARAVFVEHIDANQGRVVDTAGDSVLAVFDTTAGAVIASVAIQKHLAEINEPVPEERRMRFRIGIHLGDIREKADGTVYGDGVNIAARLQSIAEPAATIVSDVLQGALRGHLDVGFAYAGTHEVKNVAEPIRAYRVLAEGETGPEVRTALRFPKALVRLVRTWKWVADGPAASASEVATTEMLPLSDKPSIVVLPFDNMSGDVEQEYFVDGLTEDIITELSRFQTFFVIARHSAFIYKGKSVKVQDVGRELGVHYVVEGSARTAGDRLRVVVQLIEAVSGNHIWAERYDHDMTDMFELQDKVTQSIVSAIPSQLASADLNRVKRKSLENMAAYDYTLRGRMHHHRGTKEDNAEALRLLSKAIELDPEFAEAYAWKSCTLGQAQARGYGDNKEELFAQEVEAAEKALSLDENNITCQWNMCELHIMRSRLEQAEFHHQKAFALNPNDPRIVAQRGELLTWQGRPVEGADWARLAMRLDPCAVAGRAHLLGRALYVARRYADAIEAFNQIPVPRYGHHAEIAGCYAQLGSDEKARLHAGEVLRLKPDFSIADHMQGLPFKESEDREHHRDGLCKAGLPE